LKLAAAPDAPKNAFLLSSQQKQILLDVQKSSKTLIANGHSRNRFFDRLILDCTKGTADSPIHK